MPSTTARKIAVGGVLSAIAILLGATRWGFIFGLFSLIQAAITPTGADALFINPAISVLPRLFIGPVAWLVYRALKGLNQVVALIVTGIAGSLTNTVLVLGMIGLFGYLAWGLIGTIAVTNGLPEAGVAALITLAVVAAWLGIRRGRRGAALE
jgi:uncharacterized membrane protein